LTIGCNKSGMETELARYDAACRALAEARSVDEVREILNFAEAQRAYAKMAKNRNLEADAFEIRKRAERRLGDMMQAQREAVGLAKPRYSGANGTKRLARAGRRLLPPSFPPLSSARHFRVGSFRGYRERSTADTMGHP
jgi:hypothetical protein